MTENDFSNLPYLQCVAKEALRTHPPTPMMLPRKFIANLKIGGYDIPAPFVPSLAYLGMRGDSGGGVTAVDVVRGGELFKQGESERAFLGVVSSIDAYEWEGCEY
ncbi:hypothetical protein Scep_030355 [Stephania cephalantha]|uniref:Cytochrome P450 n=1 Tax=Stephania cephalantha TaxID=152367 RepID=A0AAP0DZF2_9MAGN